MKNLQTFEGFINESVVNETRAPKTKEELMSALDDAYSKLDTYNTKYYEISTAPGGGSWSSNSKEGKTALRYKKMADNQQANIWKWTDKLRKLGFEYNTNESVNEASISGFKLKALGAKLLTKIKIGTELVTDKDTYTVTGFGPKANAFQEFEVNDSKGNAKKVKLTAMYTIKLEVTDDPRSSVYRREEMLSSINESLVNEGYYDTTIIDSVSDEQLKNFNREYNFSIGGNLLVNAKESTIDVYYGSDVEAVANGKRLDIYDYEVVKNTSKKDESKYPFILRIPISVFANFFFKSKLGNNIKSIPTNITVIK